MESALLVLAIAAAVAFNVTSGFHDAAEISAPAVVTRALRPAGALGFFALMTFLGPFVAGTAVADHSLLGAVNGCGSLTDGVDFNQAGLAGDLLDPLLGPLAKNGGPTRTHALLTDSPAIDAGGSCAKTTDQRGVARPKPAGGACDVGAYERS